jgi:tetratricopeptide (TPR) repeat protein
MSSQSRRCPTCLSIMPLARRKCPSCQKELLLNDDTRTLEVLFLQEELTGKFEILSELSRSGNSTLFLTQDLVLERYVALKTTKFDRDVSPDLANRWNQNLRRCIRLDEPHLARIYSFGAVNSLQYIILEYISDKTLEKLLDQEPDGVPLWKCLRMGRDIAMGLHSAHNLGICHHRLTPANISISDDGFCRILDLGAAEGTIEALAQRPWSENMDSSQYYSPEQIETGFSEPASDQYRLGLIMYHALTGKLPFSSSGEEGAFERLQTIPELASHHKSSIPEDLSRIIAKALSRHPDDRYDDCLSFANDLEALEPDIWLPDIETVHKGATHETTVALVLSEIQRRVNNRDYSKALMLCEQALAMAPYNNEVIASMLRIQKLHEKELKLLSIVNKALVAFYSDSLDEALNILRTGRHIDKDNPEILRLTHEVMHEQERQRLITVLLDAARIDMAKQSFSSAMSNVIRVLDIDSKNETAQKLKQRIEFGMKDRASLGVVLIQAETAYKNNNLDDADRHVSNILHSDPGNLTAKKLKSRIQKQKKHRLLMELWENMDSEMRNGRYQNAMILLRKIAHTEPSLKHDIRNRLVNIREKLETTNKHPQTPKPEPAPSADSNAVTDIESPPNINHKSEMYADLTLEPSIPRQSDEEESGAPAFLVNSTESLSRKNPVDYNKMYTMLFASVTMLFLLFIPFWLFVFSSDVPDSKDDLAMFPFEERPNLALELNGGDIPVEPEEDASNRIPPPEKTETQRPSVQDMEQPVTDDISETIYSMIISGKANEDRGNFILAAALYREVLKTYPDNKDALTGLDRCTQHINLQNEHITD